MCSTALPYLNNYFLEKYGWRNSFWILSAISLNTCVLGALVRPIENVTTENADASLIGHDAEAEDEKENTVLQRISNFLSTYWVGLCLLLTNIVLDLCFFVPNVFIVPLVRALGYTPEEGAMLLSFISIGDIICRPLNGVLMTRFKPLVNNLLLYFAVLTLIMSLNQLFVALAANFAILVVYTLLYGCLYGLISTVVVSSVPTLMGTKNIDKLYGIFFSTGSFSLLVSVPVAGKCYESSHFVFVFSARKVPAM